MAMPVANKPVYRDNARASVGILLSLIIAGVTSLNCVWVQAPKAESDQSGRKENPVEIPTIDMPERMQRLRQLGDEIDADLEYLRQKSSLCDGDRDARIRTLEEKVTAWRISIDPSIDSLERWIAVQHQRLTSGTATVSAEFIGVLLTRYQQAERDIAMARVDLNRRADKLDALLEELGTQGTRNPAGCPARN
jgi:hypothetical protein